MKRLMLLMTLIILIVGWLIYNTAIKKDLSKHNENSQVKTELATKYLTGNENG